MDPSGCFFCIFEWIVKVKSKSEGEAGNDQSVAGSIHNQVCAGIPRRLGPGWQLEDQ